MICQSGALEKAIPLILELLDVANPHPVTSSSIAAMISSYRANVSSGRLCPSLLSLMQWDRCLRGPALSPAHSCGPSRSSGLAAIPPRALISYVHICRKAESDARGQKQQRKG